MLLREGQPKFSELNNMSSSPLVQLFPEDPVSLLRICPATSLLHDLTYQEPQRPLFAGMIVSYGGARS